MDTIELKKILELHRLFLAGNKTGSRANLRGANLRGANLRGANLRGANLYEAYLYGANLYGADLRRAEITNTKFSPFQLCPEIGGFDAFKCLADGSIARIRIPADAKRMSSLVGRKCRAEFVIVLDGEGVSSHDNKIKYLAGATVVPDSYNDDIRIECSHGIHFFMTKQEAIDYV